MKKTFLYITALLFVCAVAIYALTTHVFETHAHTPVFAKQKIIRQFAP